MAKTGPVEIEKPPLEVTVDLKTVNSAVINLESIDCNILTKSLRSIYSFLLKDRIGNSVIIFELGNLITYKLGF